jgi:hypothetical protein
MTYDLIMLIISSNDLPVYKEFRNIISAYHAKYKDRVRHFYVEFKPDMDEDVLEIGEYIYVKGVESFHPGIYNKTMAAIRHINSKYNYRHIIRTNVSSLWNLENTLAYQKWLPIFNFAGGILHEYNFITLEDNNNNVFNFITGTGIFMTKDVADKLSNTILSSDVSLVSNTIKLCAITEIFPDDVSIGFILGKLGYELNHIGNEKWRLCINDSYSIDDFKYNELYYRIKNNDRNIDIILFYKLYNQIY